jgi:large subunit ribosomal protein L24
MKSCRLRVKDKVMVVAGKDKGKIGTIKSIDKKKEQVIVEQVNMVKRHVRGNPYAGKSGGIQDKEAPIHISNVALMCDSCTRQARVGYRYTDDGRKMRFCKKCQEMLER